MVGDATEENCGAVRLVRWKREEMRSGGWTSESCYDAGQHTALPATQILSPLVPRSCLLTDWSRDWSEKPGPVAAAKQVSGHLADTADQSSPVEFVWR